MKLDLTNLETLNNFNYNISVNKANGEEPGINVSISYNVTSQEGYEKNSQQSKQYTFTGTFEEIRDAVEAELGITFIL